jgi:ferric-dicitrate binding protein FerR (iron transport regulator)
VDRSALRDQGSEVMLGNLQSWPVKLLLAAALLQVCLAQSTLPPSPAGGVPDGAAQALVVAGRVSVLRNSTPWVVAPGDAIKVQEVVITGVDGYAVFQVSDGSTFEVFPNSRVTFRNNPSNWRDLLDVWIGKVKVSIQHLTGQPNHNRIHTPTAVISVRGTVFVVDVEDEDATTMVLVESGQVAVQHALLPRGNPRLLGEGEWIRIYRGQPLASRSVDKDSILRTAVRALSEALYTAATRTPRGGTGGGTGPIGGGGAPPTLPGDPSPGEPPPPPPPPPPGG